MTTPTYAVLLGLVALAASRTTFYRPFGRSAILLMGPAAEVAPANALLATGSNVAMALRPIAAGVLVASVGAPVTLLVDAGTSALAALLLLRLPSPRVRAATGRPGARE